jgi:hypothetical protein
MNLKEILREEQKRIKDFHLEEDEYGVKRLWINQQHLLHLRSSPDDNYFYLYAKIAPVPPLAQKLKIYEELLKANLFGTTTGHAVLALHASSNSLILMHEFEAAHTTFESYTEYLQDFINYLVYWKDKMGSLWQKQGKTQEDLLQIMSKKNQTILFI